MAARASEEVMVVRDPWRWAWWALLALWVVLFGSSVVGADNSDWADYGFGLVFVAIGAGVLFLCTRTKVIVAGSRVTVVNQGRRYVVDRGQIRAVVVRRARLLWCAHLVIDDDHAIPVAAISATINTLTGEDTSNATVKANDLARLIGLDPP
jgi:hypothetical protein